MNGLVLSPSQILAEPVRVYLIELLCTGCMTSGDLATMCFDRFRVSWGTVSRHLGVLVASGFVRRFRERNERWYGLEPDWLHVATADIRRLEAIWSESVGQRQLGFGAQLYEHAVSIHDDDRAAPPATTSRRGLRGGAQSNRADFGAGRSEESEHSDGGGAFD